MGIDCKVTWKFGVDSHTELVKLGGYRDETADPSQMTFARVEITPDNKSYLEPDNWSLRVDESIQPAWFGVKHKEVCFAAHKKWSAKLYKILIRKKIVHPFEIVPPKITKRHVALLREWDSVGGSVWSSVGGSVWSSVRDSVRSSVGDSVWGYAGSFFSLPKWKHTKHVRGKYPFASVVKLWEAGLVPNFDGMTWRLHGGKKAVILFTISAEDLRKKKSA